MRVMTNSAVMTHTDELKTAGYNEKLPLFCPLAHLDIFAHGPLKDGKLVEHYCRFSGSYVF